MMKEKNEIKVLMTGAGAPGAAGIISCLKKDPNIHLTVCDANPNAVGKYLNPDFEVILPAHHPEFISTILSLCTQKNIQVVMPLVTKELDHFAKYKNTFEDLGIKVLVSNEKALTIANDKSKLYSFLKENGIRVPDFKIVNTIDEFKNAITYLGYPKKKMCFKPSVSNGSRGFRVIDPSVDEFHLLFNEKPNSTFISYEKIIEILNDHHFPELLVSEYLPGDEYSVDCIANNGEPVICVPRKRTKMSGGISVEGEFVNNEAIINYCKTIISKIKLHGNIGIQVKQAEDGTFLILEINPRVQGTIVAGLGAGINLPLLAVKQELNIPLKKEELSVKWGTRFSRYWQEAFY
jgi:carbamoyl-phosphate synthase large subunit